MTATNSPITAAMILLMWQLLLINEAWVDRVLIQDAGRVWHRGTADHQMDQKEMHRCSGDADQLQRTGGIFLSGPEIFPLFQGPVYTNNQDK